ncbi:MAG: serine/threonine protein phosphatase [Sphingomonadales bacterium]|nr:serine/threonine protein phosphatase [Sphingomonadales bacterium]
MSHLAKPMISLRNPFRASPAQQSAAVPAGERVYAIGDIHGCLPQLEALARSIEQDDVERGPADTTVILLGDLVDRGPDSAGVVAFARAWQQRRRVRILAGNHEELFLDSFGNADVLREFLRFGGRETLFSYGVDPAAYARADINLTLELLDEHVPQADRDFITRFEDSIAIGDYLFVHAGIRPGVGLDEQQISDLRWIRGTFLDHSGSFGAVVVHGHTIFAKPEVRANRIGIDTGAYASGQLTALGLEGTSRWLISTQDNDGVIEVAQRSI